MTRFEILIVRLLMAILRRIWQLMAASQVAVSDNDTELLDEVVRELQDDEAARKEKWRQDAL